MLPFWVVVLQRQLLHWLALPLRLLGRRELQERYGSRAAYELGMRIDTAIDLRMQAIAEKSVRDGLKALDRRRGYRGPVRSLGEAEAQPFLDKQEKAAGKNGFAAEVGHMTVDPTPSGPPCACGRTGCIEAFAGTRAVELPYGRKRALEIATTLALDPEMMLLDEPTAGMAHEDVDRISALIRQAAVNRTVLMVEHNLSVVANLSDTITVLARGEILAEGDYAAVSRNAEVIQAYMGKGEG